jgi:hypothetical protein
MLLLVVDRFRKKLMLTVIPFGLALVLPVVAAAQGKIGDESDGSRAGAVHLIPLFDAEIPELDKASCKILRDDDLPQPFSTRQTCGKCHTYEEISKGWHFNAFDANVVPGRAGEPWICVDAATATQIPLSYRSWSGTFRPEQIGLTPWQFTKRFARQMPGGGVGELDSEYPDERMRQFVSGKLEINCLSCHNAHSGQDQSDIFGYASQIARENFRWAGAASCEFASVKGAAASQGDTYDALMSDAIAITYRQGTFDHRNRVLFNIVREVPEQRCYFCHSEKLVTGTAEEKWATDEDVHLAAGLTCVDCHRHGLDHRIARGYEWEVYASQSPADGTLTCKGCHLETESSTEPAAGRLGAPRPKHVGIPPVHFEELTCTACHSGPWPAQETYRTKTSRAHGLGLHLVNKSDDALPHVIAPVFAKQQGIALGQYVIESSKIAPHRLIWPAFWATLKDQAVSPIELEVVKQTLAPVIGEPPSSGDWASLGNEQITQALGLLSDQTADQGKAAYVSGGKTYYLDDSGKLKLQEHSAASPCMWPIAHNVRPAAQSLGVRGCKDCHSAEAPFFFGRVAVDSPVAGAADSVKTMVEFQHVDELFIKVFNMSFVFRPWLKIAVLASAAIIAVVLLLYGLKALDSIAKTVAKRS